MGNFFSDVAGGFLGQGPGTDQISGYEALGTIGRRAQDIMRGYLSEDEDDTTNIARGRAFFRPGYEALPTSEREGRVEELGNVYKAQFNPFLQDVFTRAEGELSKSGLLTSTRAAALKGKLGSDLALQSMLPTVQYKHQLSDVNRAETLRNRMMILDRALGINTPNTIEIGKPSSLERAYGSYLGKGVDTFAKMISFGQGGTMPTPFTGAPSRYQDPYFSGESKSIIPSGGVGGLGPR